MEGYNFVRMNRSNKPGGGVAIFVLEDINFKLREDLTFSKDCLESIFVECLCGTSQILIGCVYRPPGTSFDDFIEDILNITHVVRGERKFVGILIGSLLVEILI